jgi:hypothetical protein
LTFFDGHDMKRAFERGGEGLRVIDPFTVAACRRADLFEGRQLVEINQRRFVAAHGLALRVHALRRPPHRPPHRIVHDYEQHRQAVHLRGMMHCYRVAEQMRAVTQDREDRPVGRSELGPKCGTAAPTEPRGRAHPEIAACQVGPAMFLQQRVLVDEDRICRLDPADAGAAQLIRDISEVIPFTRALDLLGAIHLMQMERHTFKSDEAFSCSTVELMRRTSRVGCKVVAMSNSNGTITRSYRREMGKESRLACAKMLTVALGAAAQALAKREAARAGEVKAVRADYWATVHAIEAAASA